MNPEQLNAHAARIRASGVLGRSELMVRLFDFLMACSLNDKAPKEIEIAIDVFGKDPGFEVARDAMVRVYMHKLRRKLEEYYAGAGHQEAERLAVPRGEYRLVLEAIATATTPVLESAHPAQQQVVMVPELQPRIRRGWVVAAAALLVAINLAAWLVLFPTRSHAVQDLNAVRQSAVWQQMVSDDQPIYVVIGDYYIFGEVAQNAEPNPESVGRLVREFNVNSRNDLEQLFKERPELEHRYMDLALRYLPVSAAFALHNVVPLFEPNNKNPRQVQVILASELTPTIIRSSHVVYIGLLSGMGMLQDIAFAGSQLRIGDTYDEIIDRRTGKLYVSQSSVSVNNNTRYRDYGYFSTFAGPNGNRIVILAGTRDVALMHTAEAVSRKDSLAALVKQAGATDNFEALYAVDAIDRMNLDGQLLLTDRLDSQRTWAGSAASVAATAASEHAF
jgi:hypothetical protein